MAEESENSKAADHFLIFLAAFAGCFVIYLIAHVIYYYRKGRNLSEDFYAYLFTSSRNSRKSSLTKSSSRNSSLRDSSSRNSSSRDLSSRD